MRKVLLFSILTLLIPVSGAAAAAASAATFPYATVTDNRDGTAGLQSSGTTRFHLAIKTSGGSVTYTCTGCPAGPDPVANGGAATYVVPRGYSYVSAQPYSGSFAGYWSGYTPITTSSPPPPPPPTPTPTPTGSTLIGIVTGQWHLSGAQDIKSGGFQAVRWDDSGGYPSDYATVGIPVDYLLTGNYNSGGISALGAPSTVASNYVNEYATRCSPAACPWLEVLNEPGGSWFWGSGAFSYTNEAWYASLIQNIWQDAHARYGAAAPQILAAYDGETNQFIGGESQWWAGMVSAVPSVASYLDGVTVHPYGGASNPAASAQGNRQSIILAHQYTGKPVYVTEIGWPASCSSGCPTTANATGDSMQWSEPQQATNVYNFAAWARSTGYVPQVDFFNYADYGSTTAGTKYGFMRWNSIFGPNYSHKPAWTAVRQSIDGQPCTVCG